MKKVFVKQHFTFLANFINFMANGCIVDIVEDRTGLKKSVGK